MSDEPTDLVFTALRQMQANGIRLRASLDACERLRAPTSIGPAKPATRPLVRDDAPTKFTPPEKRGGLSSALHAALPSAAETPRPQPAPPLSTAGTSGKAAKLAALRDPVLACMKCAHLAQSRTQVVFGVGNPDAELMFVGEAPGADEDLVGEPFVGKAGQLLTKMIETMGFRRADVYIANILKCRPNVPPGERENREPTAAEMEACKPYLLQQIDIIQPKVIVALGATAVEGLLDLKNVAVSKMRGSWKEFHGIPMMPTFHPSYLLHKQSLTEKRKVWEDMLAVLEKLGHEITDKQRGFFLPK